MTRTGDAALRWAKSQHDDGGREWHNICLIFVHDCFDVGAYYPSASRAWYGAAHKHPTTDGNKVPRGVPYFWTGGSQGYGHIVISAGGGLCWSTDINVRGGVSLVRINDITRRWGQTPRGWTEDLNRVRVWKPAPMPVVDLSDLAKAHKVDPDAKTGHHTTGAVADVTRLERALAARGYLSARRVDGSYGTATVAAMRAFQRDHGFKATGTPTKASVVALGANRFRVQD